MALPVFSTFHPSALIERANETVDHVVFVVRADDAMHGRFTRAGQFVKMRVSGADGRVHEGIFALASAPFERRFAFLARMNNPEGGEAADRIARMEMRSALEITEPAGEGFPLERARGRDLAFVAVGTALAPVRSAIETVLRERDAYGALSLDYGLHSDEHLPFGKDIARWRDLGVDVALHIGRVQGDTSYEGTRAQDALFRRLGARANETTIVAVGHDPLVREVRARYVEAGGAAEQVLHNY